MNALNNHFETPRGMLHLRDMNFIKPLQSPTRSLQILSQNFKNLTPLVNLAIKMLKSKNTSLASAHVIAYVII